MALPINIEKLIKGTVVETERIEFKTGWNPESVLHTMCAFANDMHNLGGGYIVIGVEEKGGNPVLPPSGLQKNQLDAIQRKLVELSNRIQPAYFGQTAIAQIQGVYIVVIYCPGGDHRPYEAPVSLSNKSRDTACWIRTYNSTVRANKHQRQDLYEMAAKIPYDDRINHQGSLDDISLGLIKEFLQEVDSRLFEQANDRSFVDLCRQLQIVKGPDEHIQPVNVGLLLFNENPHQFFPGAKIEVVIYRDEIGDQFSEKIFSGPIHRQITQALEYLQTNVIREEVKKVKGQAQANRFYNYPYAAIEEVLANAVYHRSYELRNTIEVNVRLDKIEILSFPGPLPPVDNEMLKKERIVSRDYRNRRIGDFLKELQLTEGRSTGFPKIYAAMEQNGSPGPRFETDGARSYFLAELRVHPDAKTGGQVRGQVRGQAPKKDLNDTEKAILHELARGPSSRSELLGALGMKKRSGYFRRVIDGLLEQGLIIYKYPDTPNHPNQKYLIMDAGRTYVD